MKFLPISERTWGLANIFKMNTEADSMFNCTEAFLTKHVRNLATEEIENSLEGVARRAGIILQARIEELDHQDPNTVMFMYPATLEAIQAYVGAVGVNAAFHFAGRIPWIVTWVGAGRYSVIRNAAGFSGNTDGSGLCCHYSGAAQDQNSEVIDWKAPGLL